MKKVMLPILIVLTMIFASCATTLGNGNQTPTFYRQPPVQKGIFFGLGSGSSMAAAMAVARDDIAGQLGVSVSAAVSMSESEQTENGETTSSSSVEISSKHTINTILEFSKRLEYEQTGDGTFYVLIFYPEDTSIEYDETTMLEEIEAAERSKLVSSTILSSVLPGTGQLMNGNTAKGVVFLGTAVGLLGAGAYGFIDSQIQYQNALDAPNQELQDYYYGISTTSLIIGAVAAGLYGVDAIISGIENYSSNN